MGADRICGIERSPGSPVRGRLVCPVVFLRREPGLLKTASGALPHGAPVTVTASREAAGRQWRQVQAQLSGVSGWVPVEYLEKEGAR